MTAAVERLAELLAQEWADYREGPDYHPTDRHAVQDTWNAGKRAALFSVFTLLQDPAMLAEFMEAYGLRLPEDGGVIPDAP